MKISRMMYQKKLFYIEILNFLNKLKVKNIKFAPEFKLKYQN